MANVEVNILEVIAKIIGVKYETKVGKVREKTLSFKKEGVVYDIKTKPVRKDAIQAGIKLYTFLGHHLLKQVEETGGTVEYLTQDERSWGLNDIRYEELDVFQVRLRDLKHMMRFVEHSIERLSKEPQS
ncbi:hypothetical protein Ddc_18540 [Ditylenchus destructor]|nr:hypothetical protein Ddc_18540 [Ditylenchus destructor]